MGTWEAGWRVIEAGAEGIVAGKEGMVLEVPPLFCAPQEPHLTPGAEMRILLPKDLPGISPGFYMALADNRLSEADHASLTRFYWNVTPEGATKLVRTATRLFNDAELPFKLKVISDPTRYIRCDAAVLYIRTRDYDRARALIAHVYREVFPYVRDMVPALTKRLAAGLSLAEDPGNGDSFGLHRCALIAEGLLRAREQGKRLLSERLAEVTACFAEAALTPDVPYLRPNSPDNYDLETDLTWSSILSVDGTQEGNDSQNLPQKGPREASAGSPPSSPDSTYIDVAADIAARIAGQAIWDGDECNWVGATLPVESGASQGRPICKALGPDLYAGTSGIALFLAELWSATKEPRYYATAMGAIRHALLHTSKVQPGEYLGLYTGLPGIAVAAARVGTLFGREDLIDGAKQLTRDIDYANSAAEPDLLSGKAGALIALLGLGTMLHGHGHLLGKAIALGDELLASACKSAEGYSWAALSFKSRHNLTGFSHGAAGIGYALLELYSATGADRYRAAAEMAFGYEDSWLGKGTKGWPDLRVYRSTKDRHKDALIPSAPYWCHGAPGITVSRLRAYELLGGERHREMALYAWNATAEVTAQMLNSPGENYSLCHGLCGNAEVLIHGSTLFAPQEQDTATHNLTLPLQIAATGRRFYSENNEAWPCGARGETPALMLGLAGIGLYYLRLGNYETPSVVIPHALCGGITGVPVTP